MGTTESGIVYPDASSPIAPTPDGLQGYFQAMAESIDASLGGASAKMERKNPQVLANASATSILWDATTYSRGGATTSSAGIQIGEDGLYDIAGQVAVGNTGLAGFIHISLAGATEGNIVLCRNSGWSATQPTIVIGSARVQCAAGDTLTLSCFHNNDAAGISTIGTTGGGPYRTALSVSWAGKL